MAFLISCQSRLYVSDVIVHSYIYGHIYIHNIYNIYSIYCIYSMHWDKIICTVDDALYKNDHIGICITYYFIDYRQCVYNHL